jgi:hypothetical protein
VVEDGANHREEALSSFQEAVHSNLLNAESSVRSAHMILTDRNCGTSKARNIGMDMLIANGSEMVAHLDGDDLLHPDFSSALSSCLIDKGIERAVSYSQVNAFQDGALQLSDILGDNFSHLANSFGPRRDLYCSVWMMPASVYREVGGYHEWMKERWEDAEFVDDLVARQMPAFPAGPYYFYRLGSVLESREKAQREGAELLWAKRHFLHPTVPEVTDRHFDPAFYAEIQNQGKDKDRRCAGKVRIELIPGFGPTPEVGEYHG